MLDLEEIRRQHPGRVMEWHASLDSTMTRAAELVRQGTPHGTVVGAEEQTAGVGRQGKHWDSPAGAGLWVSITLSLDLSPERLPLVNLVLGLAAHDAVARTSGLISDLRWPNDLLIGGRKLAGILVQLEHRPHGLVIIAGIGINVLQHEFPSGLETPATSLALEGSTISREALLEALITAVDDRSAQLTAQGPAAILEAFGDASSYVRGLRVRAEADGRILEGVTAGLDPSGFLLVREDSGTVVTILAGGVRPV